MPTCVQVLPLIQLIEIQLLTLRSQLGTTVALGLVMQKITTKTIAIATAATLGAIGCFLPFLGGMSLSKISNLPVANPPSLYMFLVPFIALLALGGVSLALSKRVARWQGIVGALFAAFVVVMLDGAVFHHGKFKPTGFVTMFTEGNIGAKLIVIGGLVALVTTLAAVVKPDPKLA